MNPREKRIDLHMEADVSDGMMVFDGLVSNVSSDGLMIKKLPKKFDYYTRKCVAIVYGIVEGIKQKFRIVIKPMWTAIKGKYKSIGFKIVQPPINWLLMINSLKGRS